GGLGALFALRRIGPCAARSRREHDATIDRRRPAARGPFRGPRVTHDGLREVIACLAAEAEPDRDTSRAAVGSLLDALEAGTVRAAEPTPEGWVVNGWVKRGLLLAFRCGVNVGIDAPPFHFRDRDTLPTQDPARGG